MSWRGGAIGHRSRHAGHRHRLGRAAWGGALVVLSLPVGLVVGRAAPSGAATSPPGYDVSYTDCTNALPTSPAFGIVGVNGGVANDRNPCLGPDPSYTQSELYWAVATSTGATARPTASLYVNTADPGNVFGGAAVADWPTSGTTPYGPCTTTTVSTGAGAATVGRSSDACAWEYGDQKAAQDAGWLRAAADAVDSMTPPVTVPGAPGDYPWWLDVETTNTWQTGPTGQAMNVADLQGMVAALHAAGAGTVGVYSTTTMWDLITGAPTSFLGTLAGLDDWVPGASTASEARASCDSSPFTTGGITMTQWTPSGGPTDGDVACSAPAPPPPPSGYHEVASDGGVFTFGVAVFHGSMGGKPLDQPIVGMATDPATGGYWEVAADGGIFAFTAPFYGSMGGKPLAQPIVGMAAMPTGSGYWEVARDGGIFTFGNARFHGSMGGQPLDQPVVGMAATETGAGYWEVASDGGIFTFGTAAFHGSMGGEPLAQPIVGMAADLTTGGYWEVAADGGVFTFTAPFLGSMGGHPLNAPVVGMAATATGGGYHEVASDGGMFTFGTAQFEGSRGGHPLNAPVVGMATA